MNITVAPADESSEFAKILEISIGFLSYGKHTTVMNIFTNLR
jgi:hypothetical protein